MTTNYRMLKVLAVTFVSAAPRAAMAQVTGSWSPNAADCKAAVDALGAGSRVIQEWSYVNQCGARGAAAVAAAITQARIASDTAFLGALLATARAMQDSSIFNASLAVALDNGATVPARAMALGLSLVEYQATYEFLGSGGWNDLISSPRGSRCRLDYAVEGDYTYASPMPSNTPQRIADVADSITSQTGSPQVVHDLAACVRRALTSVVPVTVPASALQFAYVCGTKFRVTNRASRTAALTYDVIGQTGAFGLAVPAKGSAAFITATPASVRLYQLGQLLATVANRNVPCP